METVKGVEIDPVKPGRAERMKMGVEKVKLSKENEQLLFLQELFGNLTDSVAVFVANGGHDIRNANYGNKNHGKTAIKRKITMLRQELLNLERMIDE